MRARLYGILSLLFFVGLCNSAYGQGPCDGDGDPNGDWCGTNFYTTEASLGLQRIDHRGGTHVLGTSQFGFQGNFAHSSTAAPCGDCCILPLIGGYFDVLDWYGAPAHGNPLDWQKQGVSWIGPSGIGLGISSVVYGNVGGRFDIIVEVEENTSSSPRRVALNLFVMGADNPGGFCQPVAGYWLYLVLEQAPAPTDPCEILSFPNPPITLEAEVPGSCSVLLEATLDPDHLSQCFNYTIDEITYNLFDASTMTLIKSEKVEDPVIQDNNLVHRIENFVLPNSQMNLTAQIEYTITCDGCEKEFVQEVPNLIMNTQDNEVELDVRVGRFYCQAWMFARLIDSCPDMEIHNITYSLANEDFSVSQLIENPEISSSGILTPEVYFNTERSRNLTAKIRYSYTCGECVRTFLTDEKEILFSQPAMNATINVEDPTPCSVGFNYDDVSFGQFGCRIVGQRWTFEDGAATSNASAPIQHFGTQGMKDVALELYYKCPSCDGDLLHTERITFDLIFPDAMTSKVVGRPREPINVLDVSNNVYSSTWPSHSYENLNNVNGLHPYAAGTAGVWRPAGSYVFNDPMVGRSNSNDLKVDGDYDAINFHWRSPSYLLDDSWILANQINSYNPAGQELENQDVLGVYSAALFSYGGDYPVAVGSNMANREMAYTSFEDMDANASIDPTKGVSGNMIFRSTEVNVPFDFKIVSGKSNVLIIEEETSVVEAKLSNAGFAYGETESVVTTGGHVTKAKILCVTNDENAGTNPFPGYTAVILDERINSGDNISYGGTLSIPNRKSGTASSITNSWGHSGNHSLQVTTASHRTSQPILFLEPGKAYFLSAWVSIRSGDNQYYDRPNLADNLQIRALFELPSGSSPSTSSQAVTLKGPIVEGWQKVEGEIRVPAEGYVDFSLIFEKGTAAQAYFDDIRLFPVSGNMQGYVYDERLRLEATLDENNYATFYSYDEQGQLFLVRKETEEGIKTIQQTMSNQRGPANE
ncbi:MAG: hypothetical protein AAF616_13360 [Bacteroidota bacterium]